MLFNKKKYSIQVTAILLLLFMMVCLLAFVFYINNIAAKKELYKSGSNLADFLEASASSYDYEQEQQVCSLRQVADADLEHYMKAVPYTTGRNLHCFTFWHRINQLPKFKIKNLDVTTAPRATSDKPSGGQKNKSSDAGLKFLADIRSGSQEKDRLAYSNGNFIYMRPIRYKSTCLMCHGNIRELHPDMQNHMTNTFLSVSASTDGIGNQEGGIAGVFEIPMSSSGIGLETLKEFYIPYLIFIFTCILAFWFYLKSKIINPIIREADFISGLTDKKITGKVDIPVPTGNEISLLNIAAIKMNNTIYKLQSYTKEVGKQGLKFKKKAEKLETELNNKNAELHNKNTEISVYQQMLKEREQE